MSPEVEVDFTDIAGKITKQPDVGYIRGDWDTSKTKKLKATFTAQETEFTFNFTKTDDIVEKTDKNTKKPDGYVQVTFKTDGNGKVNGADEKIYYVNPTAGIKLGKTATADNKTLVVPTPTANTNYVFDKWQEAIDETNPITSERVHVAIFISGQVTLTYNKGGDDITGEVPATTTVNYGTTVRLAGKETLAKPNAEFAGWKLDEDETIYQPGDQVKLEKARTATAQWTTAKHTVTFDTKGGNKVDSQTVEHGKTLTNVTTPTQKDKVFMGWKEKESDKTYFDFANTAITADKTLIAIWQNPVQKIGENDPVEEQFIKVTFLKGAHGTLKDGQASNLEKVTYKVVKDYNFDQAVKAGLEVPGIDPAKYYKSKSENDGWDKALDLTLATGETEKVFTAQYEPNADVIPVDPKVTDKDQIKKEKPEGMVLVEFKVDETKAYMLGNTKFYVTKDKLVEITPPLVVKTVESYDFEGWGIDKTTKKVTRKFVEDTIINSDKTEAPDIIVQVPRSGVSFVEITNLTEGATGHLVLTRNGQEYEFTSTKIKIKTRVRRKTVEKEITCFDLREQNLKLQANDKICIYATKGSLESDKREYTIR